MSSFSTPTPPTPPRGRRAGGADTREAVLQAARQRFLAHGYQSVTMRSIAADAGVDVALLGYYFGSKQALFGAAMSLGANPAEVIRAALPGDRSELPERLVRSLVGAWDDPVRGAPLRTLVGAAGHEPGVARLLREMLESELVEPVAELIGGADGRQRAGAFAIQLAGIVFARYVLELDSVARTPIDDLVRHLAPAMGRILDD